MPDIEAYGMEWADVYFGLRGAANPFELAVAERLATLKADIDRVESRLNWLFALIIGAAVTNVVIALLQ